MTNCEIEVIEKGSWLRGPDLNRRPSGYEPDELPSCSTPRPNCTATTRDRAVASCCLRLHRRALALAMDTNSWLRGPDLNRRPSGYEPDELPSCSTPRPNCTATTRDRAVAPCCLRLHRRALALAMDTNSWLRGPDLNRRPSGYEPDELPSCSTPRPNCTATTRDRAVAPCCLRLHRRALALAMDTNSWLRGPDLNRRPSGYEPDELPSCSTPRPNCIATTRDRAVASCCLRLHRRR